MLKDEPSADNAQSESFSELDRVSDLTDGEPDGRCSGQRRSQSETSSVDARERLSPVGESMQITRMPPNGMTTSNTPSASFRISAPNAAAPYVQAITLSSTERCAVNAASAAYAAWSRRGATDERVSVW